MSFPGSLISYTNPSGTSLLTSPDHALMHTSENNELVAIEAFLGTNSGTNVFGGYTAGQQPLPIKSGTLGTVIASGTINNSILGTPSVTGGTLANLVFNNGTLGTNFYNGGTANLALGTYGVGTLGTLQAGIGTIGTLAGGSLTTGNFQTGQFLRPLDNAQNYKIQWGTKAGTFSSGSVITIVPVFSSAFSNIALVAMCNVVATTNNPIGGYLSNPYSLTAGSMNIEVRYLGGNTTDTISINYLVIGY